MTITVTRKIIQDDANNVVIKYNLVSDAASDASAQELQDVSDLSPAPIKPIKIMKVVSTSSDMDIDLHWDGNTADQDIINLPAGDTTKLCFREFGGLVNPNAHTHMNYTGDIMFSTRGAAADSEATIILYMVKRDG